jgi:hypothetical protein
MTKTPVTTREHVNVTGKVPTIAQAAALLLRAGYRPQLLAGAVEGTANIRCETMASKHIAKLHGELLVTGWAFTHDAPIRKGGWHCITVLVSL